MKKKRFMVVSGFLGAGKTTSMIAFSEYIDQHYGKAAILTNDLGAKNLVDLEYTSSSSSCCVTPITGDCICYQTENLVDKLRRLGDIEHADIIMSDIPGCGIGALDHVYHKLNNEYTGEFELAPFVVITDPERLRMIMPEHADINLPEEMRFLLKSQLKEADAIVLNKIDLLNENEIQQYLDMLKSTCPDTPVFAISAKDKTNIKEVVDFIMTNKSNLKVVDIGYGGPEFIAAESKLSWYNRNFFVKTQDESTFDGNEFVKDYIEKIREKLIANKRNVPHLKVFATAKDDDYNKSSLIGVDYEILYDSKIKEDFNKLKVIVNARAACESKLLDQIMDEALEEASNKYNLDCQVYFTECFGMMDEGRQ